MLKRAVCRSAMSLFVEKYKPRRYTDLLSDEKANLTVLNWLKSWDGVVFGASGETAPEKPVILLSGPPGSGKTTMAVVIAKMCNYEPQIIDASNERTAKSLRTRINTVTKTKAITSFFGQPGKRKDAQLLIFDEIDGADGQAAVAEVLRATRPKKHGGPRMPVVCICNNPFIPAMRALRMAALHVPLGQVAPTTLRERVCRIAQREEINISQARAKDIITACNQDLRSTLMALQYLALGTGGRPVTKEDVAAIPVASGDPRLKDQVRTVLTRTAGDTDGRMSDADFFKTVRGFKDERLVYRAMEAHWSNLPYPENPTMGSTCAVSEALSFTDIIQATSDTTMDFSLLKHRNIGFMAPSEFISYPVNPISREYAIYPRTDINAHRETMKHVAMAREARLATPAPLLPFRPPDAFRTAILPTVLRMLALDRYTMAAEHARGGIADTVAAALGAVGVSVTSGGRVSVQGLEDYPAFNLAVRVAEGSVLARLIRGPDAPEYTSTKTSKKVAKRKRATASGGDEFQKLFTAHLTRTQVQKAVPDIFFVYHEGVTRAVRVFPQLADFV
ncbi:Chromosome transmision fidelity factor 18, CTF18 [Carpediemonas membranifera]|uniref:Chromosome transmision fidelity factor 18, CTF18 n=1 Tax=Carpediemonas membranifera TaxID=201153 RepID=A0A8J6B1R6_9EUKA|nr:Chromosome transmision fidelity factor 18, CTF18 [Carpediemonas membranifera]|eukprot:KAG9391064.1 Chromosome transmision fidelity factor 18, CTF18 [Carpediemonas membranifera]